MVFSTFIFLIISDTKKLIRFVLVLALGAFLGYVFHDTIDGKLKDKLGEERTEEVKAKTQNFAENAGEAGKAAFEAGKEVIKDSATTE